jgi:serine/threonine protein kinase
MATPNYIGLSAKVFIHESTVEKRFNSVMNRAMFKAEEDALRFCSRFSFVPKLLSTDADMYSLTMQRVGKCDALEWFFEYGKSPLAKKAMKEVAKLLRRHLLFLHEQGVYHGDVKPENTTLQFDAADPFTITRVYLIDFATSSFLNPKDPKHRKVHVCSDFYSTPESSVEMYRDSKRDDVWGFVACLFLWISCGVPMFGRNDFWLSSFKDWYIHGYPWYWFDIVKHETLTELQCNIFKGWFTDLKLSKEVFEFPSEEEIEKLFEL